MKFLAIAMSLFSITAFANEKPQYEVPNPASTFDSQCITRHKSRSLQNEQWSEWEWHQSEDLAVAKEWISEDNSQSIALEEGKDGTYMVYTHTRAQKLQDGGNHILMEVEDSYLDDGKWNTVKSKIERIRRTENGKSIVTYNAVNGVETPYYWENFTVSMSASREITTSIHTKPSIKNTAKKEYSDFYVVCELKKRS